MNPVVDLRDEPGAVTAPTPSVPQPFDTPRVETAPSVQSRGRLVVLIVLASIIGLIGVDIVAGSVAGNERQRHLADIFAEPKADLVPGDPSMVIQSERIGLNHIVVEGSSAQRIRGGPGRRLENPPPGGGGNTVIFGRSERFGGPFGQLSDLVAGDRIVLQARGGQATYAYKVTKVAKVPSGDTDVLDPEGAPRLTLVTSAGGPLDGRRLVVVAAADGDQTPPPGIEVAEFSAPEKVGPFDQRSGGGMLLLLAGVAVVVIGIVGANELRVRYQPATVVAVAGPAIVLGVALILFNLDVFLPTTF